MVPRFGIILFFCLQFSFADSFSQEKNMLLCEGTLKGVIMDSAYNFLMPGATISIYAARDSTLLHYTISDNLGAFHFSSLCYTPSYIVVTYLGYYSVVKSFLISEENKNLDLKQLSMYRKEVGDELKEVVVTAISPMRMNGDTLEFNADAFKLDSNAVVEDLVRRLPGLTVWGDGEITFNGRRIQQVLVDGKPFFGGKPKLATQNLPKKSVDKIQIYSDVNLSNPLDSLTSINIKLKKGSKSGFFGKMAAGYGTNNRYELDGSLNHFSKKTQLSLFGSSNNTNKIANDINTLLLNHTYKGISPNFDWHSNFRIPGISTNNFWGGRWQKDFIENPDNKHKHRLNIEYFHKGDNNKISSNLQLKTSLDNPGKSLIRHNQTITQKNTIVDNAAVSYEKNNNGTELFLKSNLSKSKWSSQNNIKQNQASNESQISKQEETNTASNSDKNMALEMGFSNQNKLFEMNDKAALKTFKLNYAFNYIDKENNMNKISSFTDIQNSISDRKFNRLYKINESSINQNIQLNYNQLKRLFFGYRNIYIDKISINNQLILHNSIQNNKVWDMSNAASVLNNSLTNKNDYNIIDYQPSIELRKSFENSLFGRYNKLWNFDLSLRGQLYSQKNESNNATLILNKNHKTFLPALSISYSNAQIGRFTHSVSLDYSTNALYPQLNQLTAIADSSIIYNMDIGNPFLKKQYNRTLLLNYRYAVNNNLKNDFVSNIALSMGNSDNKITDSAIYDNGGRSTLYFANADGYRFLQGSLDISRSFKIRNTSTLQLKLVSLYNISKNPNYINNVLNIYNTSYNKSDFIVLFGYKDFWAVHLKQGFYYFHSKQNTGISKSFTNQNLSTELSIALNLSKHFSYGTNINFYRSSTSFTFPINYTIWNMNLSYRFMKSNQAEIKFSALDLLHQNKNIINYGDNNNSTIGTQNVLSNFYLLSFAYYPRSFNKK